MPHPVNRNSSVFPKTAQMQKAMEKSSVILSAARSPLLVRRIESQNPH